MASTCQAAASVRFVDSCRLWWLLILAWLSRIVTFMLVIVWPSQSLEFKGSSVSLEASSQPDACPSQEPCGIEASVSKPASVMHLPAENRQGVAQLAAADTGISSAIAASHSSDILNFGVVSTCSYSATAYVLSCQSQETARTVIAVLPVNQPEKAVTASILISNIHLSSAIIHITLQPSVLPICQRSLLHLVTADAKGCSGQLRAHRTVHLRSAAAPLTSPLIVKEPETCCSLLRIVRTAVYCQADLKELHCTDRNGELLAKLCHLLYSYRVKEWPVLLACKRTRPQKHRHLHRRQEPLGVKVQTLWPDESSHSQESSKVKAMHLGSYGMSAENSPPLAEAIELFLGNLPECTHLSTSLHPRAALPRLDLVRKQWRRSADNRPVGARKEARLCQAMSLQTQCPNVLQPTSVAASWSNESAKTRLNGQLEQSSVTEAGAITHYLTATPLTASTQHSRQDASQLLPVSAGAYGTAANSRASDESNGREASQDRSPQEASQWFVCASSLGVSSMGAPPAEYSAVCPCIACDYKEGGPGEQPHFKCQLPSNDGLRLPPPDITRTEGSKCMAPLSNGETTDSGAEGGRKADIVAASIDNSHGCVGIHSSLCPMGGTCLVDGSWMGKSLDSSGFSAAPNCLVKKTAYCPINVQHCAGETVQSSATCITMGHDGPTHETQKVTPSGNLELEVQCSVPSSHNSCNASSGAGYPSIRHVGRDNSKFPAVAPHNRKSFRGVIAATSNFLSALGKLKRPAAAADKNDTPELTDCNSNLRSDHLPVGNTEIKGCCNEKDSSTMSPLASKIASILKSRSLSELYSRARKTGLSSSAHDLHTQATCTQYDEDAVRPRLRRNAEKSRAKCKSMMVESSTHCRINPSLPMNDDSTTPSCSPRSNQSVHFSDQVISTITSRLSVNSHLSHNRHSMPSLLSMHDLHFNSDSGGESPVTIPSHSQRLVGLTMKELVLTERDYTQSLSYVVEEYVPECIALKCMPRNRLRGSGDDCSSDRDDDWVSGLFGNLQSIEEFHSRHFMQDMESCEAEPFTTGACFLKYREEFLMYSDYIKNKPQSDALMAELGAAFFKNKQTKLADPLDLASYLLKPVQRLGKYALILRRLLKQCPDEGEDGLHRSELQEAEDMVRFCLRHGNDLLAMDALCDEMGFAVGLDFGSGGGFSAAGRLLVRQDEMLVTHAKRTVQRRVFLFQHLILFSKSRPMETGHEKYTFKFSLKMSDVGLTESIGNTGTKFEIWFRKRKGASWILQAPSQAIKEGWVKDISLLLWSQARVRRDKHTRSTTSVPLSSSLNGRGPGTESLAREELSPSSTSVRHGFLDELLPQECSASMVSGLSGSSQSSGASGATSTSPGHHAQPQCPRPFPLLHASSGGELDSFRTYAGGSGRFGRWLSRARRDGATSSTPSATVNAAGPCPSGSPSKAPDILHKPVLRARLWPGSSTKLHRLSAPAMLGPSSLLMSLNNAEVPSQQEHMQMQNVPFLDQAKTRQSGLPPVLSVHTLRDSRMEPVTCLATTANEDNEPSGRLQSLEPRATIERLLPLDSEAITECVLSHSVTAESCACNVNNDSPLRQANAAEVGKCYIAASNSGAIDAFPAGVGEGQMPIGRYESCLKTPTMCDIPFNHETVECIVHSAMSAEPCSCSEKDGEFTPHSSIIKKCEAACVTASESPECVRMNAESACAASAEPNARDAFLTNHDYAWVPAYAPLTIHGEPMLPGYAYSTISE